MMNQNNLRDGGDRAMNETGTAFHAVNGISEHSRRVPEQTPSIPARNPGEGAASAYLLPDREPPPWNPELELFRRWKRRPRCEC